MSMVKITMDRNANSSAKERAVSKVRSSLGSSATISAI